MSFVTRLCPHIASDSKMFVCASAQLKIAAETRHQQTFLLFILLVFSITTFL